MEFEFQQVYDGDSSPINMGPEFQQDTDTCHDDVLQAMLKRKRIPRNWEEKQLKQLIELYHLSGSERKGIGNLYKQMSEATGSAIKTIKNYLTFLRTPSKHSSNEDGLLAKFFMLKEAECRNERQETMTQKKESVEFQRVNDGDSSPINMGLKFQRDTCHNDILSAMLKRERIPRNWGEKELKQLIKLYHLTGGERNQVGNLYK